MTQAAIDQPIEDSVAKVDQEVAVGEDLEFQRKWWRFEKVVWIFFALVLVLDLTGLLGRGPLAHYEKHASDGSIEVKYERIERSSTPSIVTINFGPIAIHNQRVLLRASQSLIKELGEQRVVPQPLSTSIGKDGLTYTFPATTGPATVELALEPAGPGLRHFTLQVPGSPLVEATVLVLP